MDSGKFAVYLKVEDPGEHSFNVSVLSHNEVLLRLPACQSLKDKRSVGKKTIAAIRNRRNISVAEIDGSNLWQKDQGRPEQYFLAR